MNIREFLIEGEGQIKDKISKQRHLDQLVKTAEKKNHAKISFSLSISF